MRRRRLELVFGRSRFTSRRGVPASRSAAAAARLHRQQILLRGRGRGLRRSSEVLFRNRFHNRGRVRLGRFTLSLRGLGFPRDRSAVPLNRRNGERAEHGEDRQDRGERAPLGRGPETPLLLHPNDVLRTFRRQMLVGRILRFQKAGKLLGFGHKVLGFGGRGDRLLHRGVFRAGKFAQGKRR